MLHKEIPFLRIGLPLCTGIISGLYLEPGPFLLAIAAIVIVSGFFAAVFFNKPDTNHIFGYTFTLSLYICGMLLYKNEKNSISTLRKEEAVYSCTLSDFPEEKENSFRLIVRLNSKIVTNGSEAAGGSMILYYKKDSLDTTFIPGDLLTIRCTPVEITNRGNPDEFDYRFFMRNHGIRYYAFTSGDNIIRHTVPDHRKLVHRALIIREKIISMYKERGITGERLALVAAITLGQKSMLDPEQKQNFIKAGVMHIMAVSGLHAVILSLFVFNLLFFLKRRLNILRILITVLILWSFAFVTGLTPSVLRATLMFSFLQAGNIMNRKANGINSVLASAFILILIRPSVIFDAGFLLSYSAVIYIISFYNDLYLKLSIKNWFMDKIWQSAVVTLVAQAGTLPLTIMLFNRFPTYFIITNIIIVPLSSLLIITGCLVPLMFPLVFVSRSLAMLLNFLTGLTESLTKMASSLPCSTLENIGMTTFECIMLTLTIFIFTIFFLRRKSLSIIYPLTFLLFFAFTVTLTEISTRTSNDLIVYNTSGTSNIGIRTGKILNLYSDSTLAGAEVRRHCATHRLKIKTNPLKNKLYCIMAGEKRIVISNSLNNNILQTYIPDIIVLTGTRPDIDYNTSFRQFPKTKIIFSGAYSGFRITQHLSITGIDTIHIVRKSGAYINKI